MRRVRNEKLHALSHFVKYAIIGRFFADDEFESNTAFVFLVV